MRNAASSWTQSGHLRGRGRKTRQQVEATPVATSYALLIGFATGRRGHLLFETPWCSVLDTDSGKLIDLAVAAKRIGLLDFKQSGSIIDVSFRSCGHRGSGVEAWAHRQVGQALRAVYYAALAEGPGRSAASHFYRLRQDRRAAVAGAQGAFPVGDGEGGTWLDRVRSDGSVRTLDGQHELSESYFESPQDLELKLEDDFLAHVAGHVGKALSAPEADNDSVVAVFGIASLFGFVRVSELMKAIEPDIRGRIVVFFPGEYEDNNYRLLDARDGWNYLAVPITLREGQGVYNV